MEPTEQLEYIVPMLNALVDRIDPSHLDASTPCDDFTVHGVLDHMMASGSTFASWFRGEEAPEWTALASDGRVPAAECRKILDDLLAAVRSPGAMDRTIHAPMGDIPGSTFAAFVAFDGAVHGWDLATSTGLRFELPPELITSIDQFARAAIGPEMRDGDAFKNETEPPEDASPLARLAAFSGRTV